SSSRGAAFAAVVGTFLIGYMAIATRGLIAFRASQVGDREHLQQAVRLAPGDAGFHAKLGRYLLLADADAPGARRELERSIQLNPYAAQAWLDLAAAAHLGGDAARERAAVEAAVDSDPRTPAFAWDEANFFLVAGDARHTLERLRLVIAEAPWLSEQ